MFFYLSPPQTFGLLQDPDFCSEVLKKNVMIFCIVHVRISNKSKRYSCRCLYLDMIILIFVNTNSCKKIFLKTYKFYISGFMMHFFIVWSVDSVDLIYNIGYIF